MWSSSVIFIFLAVRGLAANHFVHLSSFDWIEDRVLVYEYSGNDHLPPSKWRFAYDPLFTPVVNNDSTLAIEVKQFGSHWRTSFGIRLADRLARVLALFAVRQEKNTDEIFASNVFALPIAKLTISMPDLLEVSPNISFVSRKPCDEKMACYFFEKPTSKIRITIISPTKEMAKKVELLIPESEILYEMITVQQQWCRKGKKEKLRGKGNDSSKRKRNAHDYDLLLDFESSTAATSVVPVLPRPNTDGEYELPMFHSNDCSSVTTGSLDLKTVLSDLKMPLSSNLGGINSIFDDLERRLNTSVTDMDRKLLGLKVSVSEQMKTIRILSKTCKPKWTKFCLSDNCFCYRVISESLDYQTNAKAYCRKYDADLVSIHSEEENDFIVELTSGLSGPFWIGYEQKDSEWQWSDGSSDGYSHWDLENYHYNYDCVVINPPSSTKWQGMHCHNHYKSVCKIPL